LKTANPHLRAILYALVGFVLWVGGDSCMKLAAETGTPHDEIMLISGPSGMAMIFLFTWLRGEVKKLRPRHTKGLSALALCFFFTYIFFLKALPLLPLANFYTIIFLTPFVVALLAALFLREKISWQKMLAILIGFCGVVVAVNPIGFFENKSNWLGYAFAFGGTATMATLMLIMRHIGPYESRECTAFYPRLGALVGGLAGLLISGFLPLSFLGIVYSVATGIIGSLGWLCMANAYKLAPTSTVTPFQYSEIITGSILGYFIWHDVPSAHLLLGAAIISASGLYIITHVSRRAAELAEEESRT
jgi:drug/metabolite transporter (DMT)-like permease